MNGNENYKMVEIFAGNIMEAGMVRSMLEDAGITTFLKDEIMGTLQPWWVAPGGAGAVKVLIAKSDEEKAGSVVDDYYKNIRPS